MIFILCLLNQVKAQEDCCKEIIIILAVIQDSPNHLFGSLNEINYIPLTDFFIGTNLTYELIVDFDDYDADFNVQNCLSDLFYSELTFSDPVYTDIDYKQSIDSKQAYIAVLRKYFNDKNAIIDILNKNISSTSVSSLQTIYLHVKCIRIQFKNITHLIVTCVDNIEKPQQLEILLIDIQTEEKKIIIITDIGDENDFTQIISVMIENHFLIANPYKLNCPTLMLLFGFDDNGEMILQQKYTSKQLIEELNVNQTKLVELKVNHLNEIYFLDAFNQLIIMEIKDNQIQLKDWLYNTDIQEIFYTFDFEFHDDIEYLRLLSENNIILLELKQMNIQKNKISIDLQDDIHLISCEEDLYILQKKKSVEIIDQNTNQILQFINFSPGIITIKQNILIMIGKDKFRNWQALWIKLISRQYLKYTPMYGDDATEILIGTQSNRVCIKTFNYTVLSNFDLKLYLKYDKIIQYIIPYPIYPVTFVKQSSVISGPNLQAKLDGEEFLDIQFKYYQEFEIDGIFNFQAKNIKYTQIIAIDSTPTPNIYYFVQYLNFETIAYLCTINYQHLKMNCLEAYTFQPGQTLNKYIFILDRVQNYVYFSYLATTSRSLEFYFCKSGNRVFQKHFQISYSLLDAKATITNIITHSRNIYITLSDKSQIDIYRINGDISFQIELKFTINQDVLQLQGYEGKFKPISIEQQPQGNYIFIVTQNQILGAYYFLGNFRLQSRLNLGQFTNIQIIFTSKTMILCVLNEFHIQLTEYYVTVPNKIIKLKDLPTYQYQLQIPFEITLKQDADIFLVRAYSSSYQQTVLLVYKAGQMLRDSLITVIPTDYFLENSISLAISISNLKNSKHSVISISSIKGIKNIIFYNDMQGIITQKQFDDSTYFRQSNISIKYSSIDSPYQQNVQQQIIFVNLQINLYAPNNQLDIEIDSVNASIFIPIQQDYFNGYKLFYEIECIECTEYVLLTQLIEPLQILVQTNKSIDDTCSYINQTQAILNGDILTIIHNQYLDIKLQFKLETTYHNIYCQNDSPKILLSNQIVDQNIIQMITCDQNNCSYLGDSYMFQSFGNIRQIQQIPNYLIILEAESYDNSKKFINGSLRIINYEIIDGTVIKYAETNLFINQLKKIQFYNNFALQKIFINGEVVYRLFGNDYETGIIWIDFVYLDRLIVKSNFQRIFINQIISQRFPQMDGQIEFISLLPIMEINYIIDIGEMEFRIISFTKSHCQIVIVLSFNQFRLITAKIQYLIQRHYNWQLSERAYLINDTLALLYRNPTNLDQIICIYDLPNKSNIDWNLSPVLPKSGHCIQQNWNKFIQFALVFDDQSGELRLCNQIEPNQIQLSRINSYAYISILNATLHQNQQVTLYANNTILNAKLSMQVKHKFEEKMDIFWYIVGGFGLLLIAIVIFILYICIKIKKKIDKKYQKIEVIL